MTDLVNLQKQEYRHEVAEEERCDETCAQIWHLFRQLETAAQYNLLEKLRDDFNLDFYEADNADFYEADNA